jgi:ankyrin repeat protein
MPIPDLTITVSSHIQEQTRTLLNDEQREALLESLQFKQIDARQMTIKTAHAKTCRWLLKNLQYLNWLDTSMVDEHHGFLWIKGNAGTGKSTLMKFALNNARKTMKDRIVLSFFFNARGEDIEKSTIGTYRSLLLQLLRCLPALKSVFDSLSLLTSTFSKDHEWSIEPLKILLEQAIRALGQSSVVCFIDALDECEDEQVREMIQFFEHIGELAVSNSIRFQVCFSSRHYPHITIRNGLELVLEGQEGHAQDITNYVETELKIGTSKTAQQIRVELQEKASGIFMWVVLVVRILNKESDRGQVRRLRQKLQDIPSNLHKLFRDILTRDPHNRDELVLCIQWILFAKQPLSPEQLHHAILSETDPDAVTEWDPEQITKEVTRLFILDSSKGLAEATVSKEPTVQFIHESVRDFLLKENGLGKIWPELGCNFRGQSHERLKQCCLNYLSIDVVTPLRIPGTLPKASSKPAADLRDQATQKFPFLEYAVRNVLHHTDTAAGNDVAQTDFLESFPSPLWVTLNNMFQKHQVRRHKKHVSCLYLLAEYNMANLIRVLGSASRCMDLEAEKYGCPLLAAVAKGSEDAVELFIKSIEAQQFDRNPAAAIEHKSEHMSTQRDARPGFVYSKAKGLLLSAAELGHDRLLTLLSRLGRFEFDSKDSDDRTALWWAAKHGWEMATRSLLDAGSAAINSQSKYHGTPLYVAAKEGNLAVVEVLLERGAETEGQGVYYTNALKAASCGGHKEIVELLLDKGADIDVELGSEGNALQTAAHEGHGEIVTLLLNKGADISAESEEYGNALQAASCGGHKEIVTLLLDKGADSNTQRGHYGNALQAASYKGSKEIVIVLLDRGANVNAQGGPWGTALQAASFNGHKEIVIVLLDRGANINAQGGKYGNALQAASSRGLKDTVALLLDKGANVNAQRGYYGNALQAASYGGSKEIVIVLLDRGVDINAQGGEYGNALQAASFNGHKEIVIVLLDRGANINAQGGEYSNALQAASSRGYKDIVTLLLDRGANINTQRGHYSNALQAASYKGSKEIVIVLLDRGANVNAQRGYYGNALQAASYGGSKEIVIVLLDRGADINAQGGEYGNALQAASFNGHKEIVKVLLDKGADINAQGGEYGNAVRAASATGHRKIVTLLLDKGANINAQGGHYGNALNAASATHKTEIVALLQRKGAL